MRFWARTFRSTRPWAKTSCASGRRRAVEPARGRSIDRGDAAGKLRRRVGADEDHVDGGKVTHRGERRFDRAEAVPPAQIAEAAKRRLRGAEPIRELIRIHQQQPLQEDRADVDLRAFAFQLGKRAVAQKPLVEGVERQLHDFQRQHRMGRVELGPCVDADPDLLDQPGLAQVGEAASQAIPPGQGKLGPVVNEEPVQRLAL